MASVEDLIATMNGGVHVGREGYDLQALQAHLAKSLAQNPSTGYHVQQVYQPVASSVNNNATSVAPPPAPASSLNSMASYTSQPGGGFGSSSAAGAGAPQGRYQTRPLITPATSFRGWPASSTGVNNNNMSAVDEEEDMRDGPSGESSAQAMRRALGGPAANTGSMTPANRYDDDDDGGDFGAFEEDAFAPLTTARPAAQQQEREAWLSSGDFEGISSNFADPGHGEGPPRPRSVHEIGRGSGGGGDSWSGFRSSPQRTSVWSNFESRNRSGSSLGSLSGASGGLQMTAASPSFGFAHAQAPSTNTTIANDSNRTARPGGGGDDDEDQDMDDEHVNDDDDEMDGDEQQPRTASGRVARLWQGRLRNRRD